MVELCQLVSFLIVAWLSHHVTLSSQDEVESLSLHINMPEEPTWKLGDYSGKVYAQPAMVPTRKLKQPVALMTQNEFKVTKLKEEEQRQRFAGRKREPMPKHLMVTDELFFELEIDNFNGQGESLKGNVTIACFGGLTPVTCLNFVSITKGYRKGKSRLQYKNGLVTKIVHDFMIQMGDTTDGSNDSIFGRNFADESFAISHNHAGWVGMANYGQDSNGSQFYVLLRTARWLDGKHVIFGKVIQGMDFIQKIGNQETDTLDKPIKHIRISKCGTIPLQRPYTLQEAQFDTDEDIERTEGDELP